MADSMVALPVVLPLLAAALSILANRMPRAQRVLGVAVLSATLVVTCLLLAGVADGGVLTARLGGWEPGIGIVLAVDPLAALMLLVSALMLLAVLIYAIGSPGTQDDAPFFHPVYLVLAAGVNASFVTADLFNLFVSFEVMLTASYVLITLGGRPAQVRHGMTYVVISLLASMLFITSVGFLYAATGTVSMGGLAEIVPELPAGLRAGFGLLFLVVFGIKAAIFPLFSWLPDSYPTAPSPVTAVFAGLLTKVGVYAIIRTQTLLFNVSGEASVVLLVISALTMLIGVLGAIAQDDVKRILSFHIVSQIGYMVFGLALFSLAGVAGAVLYIVHHIVVKTTLFLVAGLLEHSRGTAQLRRLGGLLHTAPAIAALFLLPALSLAGIPPFSGFVAKLALVQAGFASGAHLVVGVSLLVSVLTLFSMTKIWTGVFWGGPEEEPETDAAAPAPQAFPMMMVLPTAALVVVSLAFVVAAGPIFAISERAAESLLERTGYIEAVTAP